jgi:hypothetical protein
VKGASAISIKRHYRKLSEKETNELVGAFAELVVACVKERGIRPARSDKTDDERPDPNTTERS